MLTKSRLVIAALLAVLTIGQAAGQPVRILGRSEPIAPSGFVIQWPMSGFEARFTGPTLTATLEDSGKNWLAIEIDGKVTTVALRQGRHIYTLFSGAPGVHTIKVVRRTGALEGPTRVIAIAAKDLAPLAAPARRVLVVGDSISAGYGVEGKDQWCAFTPATQNARKAWPALLAQTFGADLQLIAVDGRGVYRNYSGDDPTIPKLLWRTLPEQAAKWKGVFEPQVIIVNVGINDFGNGDPGPGFDATYANLLAQLRQKFPEAQIIASLGGMLDEDKLSLATSSIKDIVAKIRAAGDRQISFVSLDPPAIGRRYGCNWHPGVDAQFHMAQTLQARVTSLLGWQPASGR